MGTGHWSAKSLEGKGMPVRDGRDRLSLQSGGAGIPRIELRSTGQAEACPTNKTPTGVSALQTRAGNDPVRERL